jgi:glucose 1-dehydrogenase
MMDRFKNKNIFITGSTSGIGQACAERFAKEGANIILNGRHFEDDEKQLIKKIEAYGNKVYRAM